MSALATWSSLDTWIVIAGVLCAVASSLLGNFLVLRRMSMLGDAITHAILPGLAVAFLITESRSSVTMFLGAVIVGIFTALFSEWIRKIGRVDEGASMGVVFSSLFALGLVMIVQAADSVHLDADCVLFGEIDTVPLDTIDISGMEVPRAVVVLSIVTAINAAFVFLFLKELKISSFDPALATSMGYSASLMHYVLMTLVAITAVACFECVGNILVVAMFVVPPATAYLLTDRLTTMIILSTVIASFSAASGHVGAIVVPHSFGFGSVPSAGMMAVMVGVLFFIAAAFSPKHGVVVKMIRLRYLAWKILADDVVGLLYRIEERSPESSTTAADMKDILLTNAFSLSIALKWLKQRGEITEEESGPGKQYVLTDTGRARARDLVRSHRLWEQYLNSQVGVAAEKLHDKAEQLEHFTSRDLREQLDIATDSPDKDPHGREIPAEGEEKRNRS